MKDLLIGISPEYLYVHEKIPKVISELHKPYFLAFCPKEEPIESARNELIKRWEDKKSSDDTQMKSQTPVAPRVRMDRWVDVPTGHQMTHRRAGVVPRAGSIVGAIHPAPTSGLPSTDRSRVRRRPGPGRA